MLGSDALSAGVHGGDGYAYRHYRTAIAGRVKGHAYTRTSVKLARATLRSEWTPLGEERS